MKHRKGFTLVELLIVMVIIAILVGIVAIASQALISRGAETACDTERDIVEVGVLSYLTETYDEYPTNNGTVPGDINWTLVSKYLNLDVGQTAPATDEHCDWQLNEEGNVFNMTVECPCGE